MNTARPRRPIVSVHGVPLGAGMGQCVDLQLVEAARNGDREAYAELLRGRAGRLYAIAQRILRDPERAEDAVQDALVLAWRDLPALRDPARFDAWLHRVVVHACLAEARRTRRMTARLVELPVDIAVGRDDYLDVVEREALDRAFLRLAPEQRVLLVLRHYAGLETAAIAEVLGVPHGTVRSRLHHAHRVMRAALEADARGAFAGGTSA
jgi:RNA polymerase sigma factor (sigma-70 family)